MNIAEIEDGKPVRGVVYAPAKNRCSWAKRRAAPSRSRRRPDAPPDFAARAPIHARTAPADGMVAVASRSHRDNEDRRISRRTIKVKDFIAAGSSLKFCLVAAGEADIYPRHGRTMEWDTAAGHAVLAAAGGSVTQPDGTPFLYGKAEASSAELRISWRAGWPKAPPPDGRIPTSRCNRCILRLRLFWTFLVGVGGAPSRPIQTSEIERASRSLSKVESEYHLWL